MRRKCSRDAIPSVVTTSKPRTLSKHQTDTSIASKSVTGDTEGIAEDSFEWTEDDMDELILTCQLSSSGKGSLEDPEPPRPHFGFSPSITQVPETQMSSRDQDATAKSRDNDGLPIGQSHEVMVQLEEEKWTLNFAEDDSLLESAAQEFELSQRSVSIPKPNGISEVEGTNKCISEKTGCCVDEISKRVAPTPSPPHGLMQKANLNSFPKRHEKGPRVSSKVESHKVSSTGECYGRVQGKNTLSKKLDNNTHCSKIRGSSNQFSKKSFDNHNSPRKPLSNSRANPTTVLPLSSRPGNLTTSSQKLETKSLKHSDQLLPLKKKPSPNKRLTAQHRVCAHSGQQNTNSVSSLDKNEFPNGVVESLLSADNFAALLEDINFEGKNTLWFYP